MLHAFSGSVMAIDRIGCGFPLNDSEELFSVWSEIFILEGMKFCAKVVKMKERFISQFCINALHKSAGKGSEIDRD